MNQIIKGSYLEASEASVQSEEEASFQVASSLEEAYREGASYPWAWSSASLLLTFLLAWLFLGKYIEDF